MNKIAFHCRIIPPAVPKFGLWWNQIQEWCFSLQPCFLGLATLSDFPNYTPPRLISLGGIAPLTAPVEKDTNRCYYMTPDEAVESGSLVLPHQGVLRKTATISEFMIAGGWFIIVYTWFMMWPTHEPNYSVCLDHNGASCSLELSAQPLEPISWCIVWGSTHLATV